MYQLPCQNCSSAISVSPSQAGDTVTCVQCGQIVAIPKLGELRKLPQTGESSAEPSSRLKAEAAGGSRIGFVVAAMLATACLVVAGFCTVRWAIVDVPITTADHIEEYATAYEKAQPAALILDFEEMEERGLELPAPYNYKTLEITKRSWGRNAMIAGALGALSVLLAIVLSINSRKPGTA